MKIHFICVGNINRSASAEIVMKKMLAARNITDIEVTSSGLNGKNGCMLTKGMHHRLGLAGYDTERRRSVAITKEILTDVDHIVYMQPVNLKRLNTMFGDEFNHKAWIMTRFTDGLDIVADPHFDGSHEACLNNIIKCSGDIINNLGTLNDERLARSTESS